MRVRGHSSVNGKVWNSEGCYPCLGGLIYKETEDTPLHERL